MVDLDQYIDNKDYYVVTYQGDVFVLSCIHAHYYAMRRELIYLIGRDVYPSYIHTAIKLVGLGEDLHKLGYSALCMDDRTYINYIDPDEVEEEDFDNGVIFSERRWIQN